MAGWKWREVLDQVTGRPTNDNVIHLRRQRSVDDILDDLDRAKSALIEHVNGIPDLRNSVRRYQLELASRISERDTGCEITVMHLPEIDLETLELKDGGETSHGK